MIINIFERWQVKPADFLTPFADVFAQEISYPAGGRYLAAAQY